MPIGVGYKKTRKKKRRSRETGAEKFFGIKKRGARHLYEM